MLVFSVSATIEAFPLHIENRRETIKCAQTWQTFPVTQVPVQSATNHIINFILRDLPAASLLRVARPEDIEAWPQII